MYAPDILTELLTITNQNPNAQLILTEQGGHSAHIASSTEIEDEFWGLNRLFLQFFKFCLCP